MSESSQSNGLAGEQLVMKYVALDQVVIWDNNPKRHDINGIMRSITTHGFVDPPKFDPSLNEGRGGLVFGNGRSKCVGMIREKNLPPPRGILTDESGNWFLPILFGIDAASETIAQALAIDHNNLNFSGVGFNALNMARIWDADLYLKVLQNLDIENYMPITVDAGDLKILQHALGAEETSPDEFKEFGENIPIANKCPHCGYEWS